MGRRSLLIFDRQWPGVASCLRPPSPPSARHRPQRQPPPWRAPYRSPRLRNHSSRAGTNLADYGYRLDEYFISGKAQVYDFGDDATASAPRVRTADAPHTTWIIVRRPTGNATLAGGKPVYDGFVSISGAGRVILINQCASAAEVTEPRGRLPAKHVPFIRADAQGDIFQLGSYGRRRTDSDNRDAGYRIYEITGAPHGPSFIVNYHQMACA